MTTNPRLVLDQLIAAFENHYEVTSSDQVDEQALLDAEEALRDAFFTYDDVLFTQYEVELPFDLIVSDDEEDEEDDDDFIDLDEDDESDDDDDDFHKKFKHDFKGGFIKDKDGKGPHMPRNKE